jgi:hypothetical protein
MDSTSKPKNENGLAAVFKEGELNSRSELSLMAGHRKTNFAERPDLSPQVRDLSQLGRKLEAVYTKYVGDLIRGCNNDDDTKTILSQLNLVPMGGWNNAITKIEEIRDTYKPQSSCIIIRNELERLIDMLKSENLLATYNKQKEELRILLEAISDYVPNVTKTFYGRVGLTATEFKFDKGASHATFESRFIDTLRIGYFFEVGASIQRKMNFLGASFGYLRANNFEGLDDQEYTFGVDTLLANGKLSKKESFTAYSGEYEVYNQFYISLDYQRMIDLKESHYLLIGPYLGL